MMTEPAFILHIQIYIYNYHTRSTISCWRIYSYFNNEKIQTKDVVLMNYAYGSSGSLGSIVNSNYIVHNTYICRRSNFCLKPTPIHGPVIKYDLDFYTQEVTSVGYHKQFLKESLISCLRKLVMIL